MSDYVDPLNWHAFTDLDKAIISFLLNRGYQGATSPQIAEAVSLPDPHGNGRIKIWHRLKRIQKTSYRQRGGYMIILDARRWRMNWEDFSFKGYERPLVEEPEEIDEH